MHSPKRIAIQGQPGSYSHLAAQQVWPGCEIISCHSFADLIEKVAKKEADAGLLPIENWTAGRVAGANELLPLIADLGLVFSREFFLPIQHHLLGLPGARIQEIRQVWSHEQALKQSIRLFEKYPQLAAMPHADTAGAAADIASWQDPTQAAIASQLAGELHGLESLASDFSLPDNATRFLALERPEMANLAEPGQPTISILFLDEARDEVGSLLAALEIFRRNGVNLLFIQSFTRQFSHAHFAIEAAGHPAEPGLAAAIRELGNLTGNPVKLLGHFPADSRRDLTK